jgi:hypothetical protein
MPDSPTGPDASKKHRHKRGPAPPPGNESPASRLAVPKNIFSQDLIVLSIFPERFLLLIGHR